MLKRKVNSNRRSYSRAGSDFATSNRAVNKKDKKIYTSELDCSSVTHSPNSSEVEYDVDYCDGSSTNGDAIGVSPTSSKRGNEKTHTYRHKKRVRNSLHIAYASEGDSSMVGAYVENSEVNGSKRDSMSISMAGVDNYITSSQRKPPSSVGSSLVNKFRDISININLCRDLVREYYSGNTANRYLVEKRLQDFMQENGIERDTLENVLIMDEEVIRRNDQETFEDLVRKAEHGDIRYTLTLFLFILNNHRFVTQT